MLESPSSPSGPTRTSTQGTRLLAIDRVGPPWGYALATLITVNAILSQYWVPAVFPATSVAYSNLGGAVVIVYGIPIVAFVGLVGLGPLRGWRQSMGTAAVQGLTWYGLLSLLAILVSVVLVAVYSVLDPSVLPLLSRPNPNLVAAESNPWFYVAFSFAVGALEETIFRGWIFGYWLARGSPRWFFHAVWTSVLFAGVHLYYGTTYGAASPVIFPTLFLTALAFAITMRNSNGNLVMVAFLHGWNDATSFLTLISTAAAYVLHYGIILLGVVIAIANALRSRGAPPPIPGSVALPPPPPPALVVGTAIPPTSEPGREAPMEGSGSY